MGVAPPKMDYQDNQNEGQAATIGLDPESWVDEHGDALFRYAIVRLRNAELAEDIVQETFAAALRAKDNFAGRSTERTWLIGILKRKIIDHFRRRWREVPATELASGEQEDMLIQAMFDERGHWQKNRPLTWSNPQMALEQKEFFAVLQGCLDCLPGRLADAFTLREIENLTTEEICQVLQITPTNLWAMLHRARMRLRQCLEAKWFGKNQGSPSA